MLAREEASEEPEAREEPEREASWRTQDALRSTPRSAGPANERQVPWSAAPTEAGREKAPEEPEAREEPAPLGSLARLRC